MSARPGPGGGRSAMIVPTAIAKFHAREMSATHRSIRVQRSHEEDYQLRDEFGVAKRQQVVHLGPSDKPLCFNHSMRTLPEFLFVPIVCRVLLFGKFLFAGVIAIGQETSALPDAPRAIPSNQGWF